MVSFGSSPRAGARRRSARSRAILDGGDAPRGRGHADTRAGRSRRTSDRSLGRPVAGGASHLLAEGLLLPELSEDSALAVTLSSESQLQPGVPAGDAGGGGQLLLVEANRLALVGLCAVARRVPAGALEEPGLFLHRSGVDRSGDRLGSDRAHLRGAIADGHVRDSQGDAQLALSRVEHQQDLVDLMLGRREPLF